MSNLSLIKGTVITKPYTHMVVRDFASPQQLVIGKINKGLFLCNDIPLEDGELEDIGSFMEMLRIRADRDLKVIHYHEAVQAISER